MRIIFNRSHTPSPAHRCHYWSQLFGEPSTAASPFFILGFNSPALNQQRALLSGFKAPLPMTISFIGRLVGTSWGHSYVCTFPQGQRPQADLPLVVMLCGSQCSHRCFSKGLLPRILFPSLSLFMWSLTNHPSDPSSLTTVSNTDCPLPFSAALAPFQHLKMHQNFCSLFWFLS